jgi:hypothetical protein
VDREISGADDIGFAACRRLPHAARSIGMQRAN